ncbi:LuxR C-terminal-related transcriptional regulator [Spirulina subsalsa]|uniref:LuxR C-terminal-related transcriptional regulator n=1 Tax=Spirulina subsalsa TaxID=54311 RepID=UPI000318EE7B|nr:response regulator transcription factor [Spirulina subsalsa]
MVSTLNPPPTHADYSPTLPPTISLLLVDDNQPFRQGLRTLLDFYNNSGKTQFLVVGEAGTSQQAIHVALEQNPTITILDMELSPGQEDGINTLRDLANHHYTGKVLVLSGHREEQIIFRAMQTGAAGYVLKDRVADQLLPALLTILNQQIYLGPEVATSFFRLFHFYGGRSLPQTPSIHLSEREQEVLNLLVEGVSNDKIAQQLYITVATVKAHLTRIFEKLGVKSRTQAIVKALKLGLVTTEG